jgi:mono/diheme cytochrome c family protein
MKMRSLVIALFAVVVSIPLCAPSAPLAAQELPDTFQNLQLFDPEISKDDLKTAMKGFTAALGVKCSFCHTIDEYHLDDNENKVIARKMMKLVGHMRANAATYFKEGTAMELISCATCHQGEAEIEAWSPGEEDWP